MEQTVRCATTAATPPTDRRAAFCCGLRCRQYNRGAEPGEALASLLRDKGLASCAIGLDHEGMAQEVKAQLRDSLPHGKFHDASDLFRFIRMIKSQDEIQRAGDKSLRIERKRRFAPCIAPLRLGDAPSWSCQENSTNKLAPMAAPWGGSTWVPDGALKESFPPATKNWSTAISCARTSGFISMPTIPTYAPRVCWANRRSSRSCLFAGGA